MNGFGHFLLRVRAFQAYWAAAALLLAVAGYLFWVRGTTTDWRGRVAIARRRFTRPVAALSGVAARRHGGVRRVHLLQHQRPQPLPDGGRPAGAAGRLREEVQALRGRSAAQDHRGQGRRRPLPARAEGADARQLRAGQQDGQAHRHRPPARSFRARRRRSTSSSSACRPSSRLPMRRSAGAATSWPHRWRLAPRTDLAFDLEIGAHGFTNTGAFTDVEYNGSFVNGSPAAADHRLPAARRADRGPGAQEVRAAAGRARARPRRSGGTGGERPVHRRRLHHVRDRSSAPRRTSSRSPRATCRRNGRRAAAGTSNTRWTARSSTSSRSSRDATP